jgi:hypothetical protein
MGQAPAIPDSFTISLGQAALIGVGVIVAISIAFGVGIQRGRSTARPSSPADLDAPAAASIPVVQQGGAAKPAPMSPTSTAIANNNGDPRIKGYRYFVLAHPSSQRAREMVDFCRKNGLDAHLVPDDNAMLRKIIVLPGYKDPSEKSSPEIKSLEANIRRVGEKWKAAAKGNQDFAGHYPELFR